jgi:hypothetical protein
MTPSVNEGARFRFAAASIERMKNGSKGTLSSSAAMAFTTVAGSPPITAQRQ